MKTPLQELIERLRKEQQTHLDVIDDHRAYHTKDVSNAIKESKVLQFVIDHATELLEKESGVDYTKMFANCKLPNEQPTKTVEERAIELYPDKPTMDIQGWGTLQLAEYERAAYIKGATDNQKQIR